MEKARRNNVFFNIGLVLWYARKHRVKVPGRNRRKLPVEI